MLRNSRQLVDAENAGQFFFGTWRKQPTQTTTAGVWFDLSMSPGNPVPNYYAASPNIAMPLRQSTDGGIAHGSNVAQAGFRKHVKTFTVLSAAAATAPLPMILCDYLLYYPFVDMSITDPQPMDNTATLPRSVTGDGVKIMAVEVAGQVGVGNPQFFINYTNSAGVSGRQTPNLACNTALVNGTIITSAPTQPVGAPTAQGPFIPLQAGDTGVRSIDSITFLSADVGLIAFVLVKPVMFTALRAIDAPVERVPILDFSTLPIIDDDAYLNLICYPSASLAGAPIHGSLMTVWG